MADRQDLGKQGSLAVHEHPGHRAASGLFGFSHRQKGQLFALDITTGRTLWTSEGRLADNAAVVRTGDVIWALTTGAELLLFRDSDKQFEPLARYKVSDTQTWAHPVISTGSVIVKDETKLTKWKLPVPAAPSAAAGSKRAGRVGRPWGVNRRPWRAAPSVNNEARRPEPYLPPAR